MCFEIILALGNLNDLSAFAGELLSHVNDSDDGDGLVLSSFEWNGKTIASFEWSSHGTADDDAPLKRLAEVMNDLLLSFGHDPAAIVGPARRHDSFDSSGAGGAAGVGTDGLVSAICCICYERKARMFFLPCRHLNTCAHCAEKLVECPSCRSPVDQAHVVCW